MTRHTPRPGFYRTRPAAAADHAAICALVDGTDADMQSTLDHKMTEYGEHFARVAEASQKVRVAEAELSRIDGEMRKLAVQEATDSLSAAGVEIKTTILTLKGKWEYQNKPILIRFLTCWSVPPQTPHFPRWQLQMHYVFARKDGLPNEARNPDYYNVACEHPSGFAAVVLARFPLWTK